MKKYLLVIEKGDEPDWMEFKNNYKRENLGTNLTEALLSLINEFNQKVKGGKR